MKPGTLERKRARFLALCLMVLLSVGLMQTKPAAANPAFEVPDLSGLWKRPNGHVMSVVHSGSSLTIKFLIPNPNFPAGAISFQGEYAKAKIFKGKFQKA